jgi:hypothetical protein
MGRTSVAAALQLGTDFGPALILALGFPRAVFPADAKTNEHKAALRLLGILPLRGKGITGDAMFCQRDLAGAIVDASMIQRRR